MSNGKGLSVHPHKKKNGSVLNEKERVKEKSPRGSNVSAMATDGKTQDFLKHVMALTSSMRSREAAHAVHAAHAVYATHALHAAHAV